MMDFELKPWSQLTGQQQAQVAHIRILPEQVQFSGGTERAIEVSRSQDGPLVCGVAVLLADRPVGLLVLKRGTAAPDWVPAGAVLISAFRLDIAQQGQGLGGAVLQAMADWVGGYWDGTERIVLSVDDHNPAGIRAYERAGWQDDGPRYQGRVGIERRMTRWLVPQQQPLKEFP
jgi:RimJ/RimL family protein N-acetyltransferase